jgi:transcriptional regulator with XRE-family HTH domain
VAAAAGIPPHQLSGYESGRHEPSLQRLETILHCGLKASLSDLLQALTVVGESSPIAASEASRAEGTERRRALAHLGPALRLLREERGRSLREVAERAGLTPAMISSYERGRVNPSLHSLNSILESGLGASFAELVRALEWVGAAREGRPVEAGEVAEPQGAYRLGEPAYSEQVAAEVQRALRELDEQYGRLGRSLRELAPARELARRMLAVVPPPSPWDGLLGPFYGTRRVERLLGNVSRQAVAERRQRRTLLGLRTADGVWVYPAFQFDERGEVLARLPAVLQCLSASEVDDWTLAGWLVSPLRTLAERSPIQWLAAGGDTATLLAVARDAAARFVQ